MKTKTYSELILLPTFEERYEYLRLDGQIGFTTFGSLRHLNQRFYNSPEWKKFRREIILRDNGCDLGVKDCEIYGSVHVHHLNPITVNDLINRSKKLLDPENAICVSEQTHKLLSYGADAPLQKPIERFKNDTILWKE